METADSGHNRTGTHASILLTTLMPDLERLLNVLLEQESARHELLNFGRNLVQFLESYSALQGISALQNSEASPQPPATETWHASPPTTTAAANNYATGSSENAYPDSYAERVGSRQTAAAANREISPPADLKPASQELIAGLINKFSRNARSTQHPQPNLPPTVARVAIDGVASTSKLKLHEQRCRMKAEGANWAFERRRRLARGGDFRTEIEPKDREIIARAKSLEGCYLWMCHPDGPEPVRIEEFEQLSKCFEVTADCLTFSRQILESNDLGDDYALEALSLLAESCSILRTQVAAVGQPTDADQIDIHAWLKDYGQLNGLYIERFMRNSEFADFSMLESLEERLAALEERFERQSKIAKLQNKLFRKLKYETGEILKGTAHTEDRLGTILRTIDELLQSGLQPSNINLRGIILPLLPVLDNLEEMPESVWLVVRELNRYQARNPIFDQGNSPEPEPSPQISQLRDKLAGKSIMLIAGEHCSRRHQSIVDAFKLNELHWETTEEHSSNELFFPIIEREDVAVVLLAVRWSSHSYGEIDGHCKKHGKPLVRLPGGLHPNQIAYQIMQQASDRIASS